MGINAPAKGRVDVWTSDAGRTEHAARGRAAASHAFVTAVLGRYGGAPADLRLRRGAYGKPRLAEPCELHFSVSRTGGLYVVAVASALVGIDVEPMGSRSPWATPDLAPRTWLAESADVGGPSFVERWTCFEAFTKALGCGVGVEVDLDLTWDPDGRPGLVRAGHDDVDRWTLTTTRLGSDVVLSLAVRTPDAWLHWPAFTMAGDAA